MSKETVWNTFLSTSYAHVCLLTILLLLSGITELHDAPFLVMTGAIYVAILMGFTNLVWLEPSPRTEIYQAGVSFVGGMGMSHGLSYLGMSHVLECPMFCLFWGCALLGAFVIHRKLPTL